MLLGEGRVPFSLLKNLPFHYLPIRVLSPPRLACGCAAAKPAPAGIDDSNFNNVTRCPVCGGGGVIGKGDSGLLGIRVRMEFPKLTIPETPPHLNSDSTGSSKLPLAKDYADAGRRAADCAVVQDEIVLRVHEAEALVRVLRNTTITSGDYLE